MLKLGRCGLMGTAVAAVLLVANSVWAADGEAEASASASVSTGLPSASATGDSDHDRFVGSFAVGYFGVRSVPMAVNPVVSEGGGVIQMDADIGAVDAPVIGVRYWFDQSMGVDFGLGIRKSSGKVKWTMYERNGADPNAAPAEFTYEADAVSQTGILVHAGLPIALSTDKHYVFELVPEANIGFSSGTVKDQAPRLPSATQDPVVRDDIKLSGFRLDLGARVGTEVHFGFIGVPNLALQASVGLFFSMQKIKADGGARPPANPTVTTADAQPKTTFEASSTDISTTLHDTPWGIFDNTVSALYYF
jgi:hypothetical protein